MKIILAPDSLKGSLSSIEAAAAMARGFRRVFPDAALTLLPMADGGEGTVSAVLHAVGGRELRVPVQDPLGRTIEASYGILEDGSVILEMAAASGLPLLRPRERNPMEASTFGTGQLLLHALGQGCQRVYHGIGGSATNDGGMGLLMALGVRFYDKAGQLLGGKGSSLEQIHRIDTSQLDPRLSDTELIVLCDVRNPLCGPQGAAVVFGAQKGASESQIALLDQGLRHYAKKVEECTGKAIGDVPGAGAAGGLGGGLMAFLNTKLQQGCPTILDLCGFDRLLQGTDLVITGEGRIDESTGFGKVPQSVAQRAARQSVPTLAIGGGVSPSRSLEEGEGLLAFGAVTDVMSLEEALKQAEPLLEAAAERVMRLLRLGMSLGQAK